MESFKYFDRWAVLNQWLCLLLSRATTSFFIRLPAEMTNSSRLINRSNRGRNKTGGSFVAWQMDRYIDRMRSTASSAQIARRCRWQNYEINSGTRALPHFHPPRLTWHKFTEFYWAGEAQSRRTVTSSGLWGPSSWCHQPNEISKSMPSNGHSAVKSATKSSEH